MNIILKTIIKLILAPASIKEWSTTRPPKPTSTYTQSFKNAPQDFQERMHQRIEQMNRGTIKNNIIPPKIWDAECRRIDDLTATEMLANLKGRRTRE